MYYPVKSKRILAKDIFADNNTWATGLNNNDLIIGPAGAGKTRGYVTPNILHAQENLVIADTKGNLRKKYGGHLEKRGYTVMPEPERSLLGCGGSDVSGGDPALYHERAARRTA